MSVHPSVNRFIKGGKQPPFTKMICRLIIVFLVRIALRGDDRMLPSVRIFAFNCIQYTEKFNFNIIGFYSILMSVLQYFRSNSGIWVFNNDWSAKQGKIMHIKGFIPQSKDTLLYDSYVIKMLQCVIKTFKKYSEKLVSRKASLLHLV